MDGVFGFDDIKNVPDNVIKNILEKISIDDLTKALIREDEKIRKLFYRNMELNRLKELDKRLKTTDAFTGHDKKMAQQKMLDIIAEVPEYYNTRFYSGFLDAKEFEEYLLKRHQPEQQYGIFDKDITVCRFFESKNGDKILEDIRAKNEAENMGNYHIPNTTIQLINYSICPQCDHVFSFKDLSEYYLNPRPDARFITKSEQFREDARVFCDECETYFLPALIIADGTPKNEVQFLCRIQTMNAIESFYQARGLNVLSRKKENMTKREAPSDSKKKKIVTGIKNDVLLKEMAEKPALISNLIQYTPANIVLSLIEGDNVKNGDLLFGEFH